MLRKGEGGVDGTFHTRDELHRIPEGLCRDVVLWCEAARSNEVWVQTLLV
jgi:hypothetical protein